MARKSPFPVVHFRYCKCGDCCAAKVKKNGRATRQSDIPQFVTDEELDRLISESRKRVEEYAATLKQNPRTIHPLLKPYPCVRNGKQVRLDDDLNVVGSYGYE